jgi:hypothetical protein
MHATKGDCPSRSRAKTSHSTSGQTGSRRSAQNPRFDHRTLISRISTVRSFCDLRLARFFFPEITPEAIEDFIASRLSSGRWVRTKLGKQRRGELKPSTVHLDFRVLNLILNLAVRQRRLAVNPCAAVEFLVISDREPQAESHPGDLESGISGDRDRRLLSERTRHRVGAIARHAAAERARRQGALRVCRKSFRLHGV